VPIELSFQRSALGRAVAELPDNQKPTPPVRFSDFDNFILSEMLPPLVISLLAGPPLTA
jgi:hypothetical protein